MLAVKISIKPYTANVYQVTCLWLLKYAITKRFKREKTAINIDIH